MSEENAAGELASLRALPKAEVHIHPGGAFDPLTLEKRPGRRGEVAIRFVSIGR